VARRSGSNRGVAAHPRRASAKRYSQPILIEIKAGNRGAITIYNITNMKTRDPDP